MIIIINIILTKTANCAVLKYDLLPSHIPNIPMEQQIIVINAINISVVLDIDVVHAVYKQKTP